MTRSDFFIVNDALNNFWTLGTTEMGRNPLPDKQLQIGLASLYARIGKIFQGGPCAQSLCRRHDGSVHGFSRLEKYRQIRPNPFAHHHSSRLPNVSSFLLVQPSQTARASSASSRAGAYATEPASSPPATSISRVRPSRLASTRSRFALRLHNSSTGAQKKQPGDRRQGGGGGEPR
jgi:hypothetical protein